MAYLFDQGLRAQILSGSGLIPMDRKDSDPYVCASYDDDQVLARTKVIENTLNPVWNEWLDLPRPPPGSSLARFTIWDADIGKDDCMGMVELRLAEGIVGQHTLNVVPKPGTKTYEKLVGRPLGTLTMLIDNPAGATTSTMGTVPPYGAETTLPAGGGAGGEPVYLEIEGANGLAKTDMIGKAEPYVKVFNGSDQTREIYRTKPDKGPNPIWGEACTLYPPANERSFLVQVFDKDRIGDDDFMGEVFVPLNLNGHQALPLQPRPGNSKDFKLSEKNNGLGLLKIMMRGRGSSTTSPAGTVPGATYPGTVPGATYPGNTNQAVVGYPDSTKPSTAGAGYPAGGATSPPLPREDSDSMKMGTVDFTIVKALNLARTDRRAADPYVAMQFDGQDTVAARTVTKPGTLAPEWNQSFNFTIPPLEDQHLVMKFTVMDEDASSSDDFMGLAFLPVGRGMDGEHRLPLMPRYRNRSDRALKKQNGNTLGLLVVNVKSRLTNAHPPMHQSGFESLKVEVIDAIGLTTSRADPYVALGFGKRNTVVKTVTHPNDVNPQWNEEFTLRVPAEESSLRVSVFDYDQSTSTDNLLGYSHVLLKANCIGDHELVLHCPGRDTRQNVGRVRLRVTGKRIYDYEDEIDFEDADYVRRESTIYGHDGHLSSQPISSTIHASSEEERTHQLAEMWRGHEATDTVYVALPLSGAVKEADEAQKRAAYDEHRRLQEEAERLRVLQQTQAHEMALQRAAFERIQMEEERRRVVERRRLQDLASYERVSLRLGGGHHWTDDIALIRHSAMTTVMPTGPRHGGSGSGSRHTYTPSFHTHTAHHRTGSPGRTSPGRGYRSPYTQSGARPPPRTRPSAPAPTAKHSAKNKKPVVPAFRDTTSFIPPPSYCKTEAYFPHGDHNEIGKRKLKGVVDFEKMSTGRRAPLNAAFMDAKMSNFPTVHPGVACGGPQPGLPFGGPQPFGAVPQRGSEVVTVW